MLFWSPVRGGDAGDSLVHAGVCVLRPPQACRTRWGCWGFAASLGEDFSCRAPVTPRHRERVHIRPYLHNIDADCLHTVQIQLSHSYFAFLLPDRFDNCSELNGRNYLLCGRYQEGGHLHLLLGFVQELRSCLEIFCLASCARPGAPHDGFEKAFDDMDSVPGLRTRSIMAGHAGQKQCGLLFPDPLFSKRIALRSSHANCMMIGGADVCNRIHDSKKKENVIHPM